MVYKTAIYRPVAVRRDLVPRGWIEMTVLMVVLYTILLLVGPNWRSENIEQLRVNGLLIVAGGLICRIGECCYSWFRNISKQG